MISRTAYRALLSLSAVSWFFAAAASPHHPAPVELAVHVGFAVTGVTILFVAWQPGTRGPGRIAAYLVGGTGVFKAVDFLWIGALHETTLGRWASWGSAVIWVTLTVYTVMLIVFGWVVPREEYTK